MNRFDIFLIILLLSSCNEEIKESVSENQNVVADSLMFSFEINDPINRDYKKSVVNNSDGKRERIDSLNYIINRVYFKNNPDILELESIIDLMTDTTIRTWYHENGQIKSKETSIYYSTETRFGTSVKYNKEGIIIEQTDHEKGYKIKLRDAINIAVKKELQQPFEIDLSEDSLNWEILIWKTTSFDTLTNEGISTGTGLSINRMSGKIQKVERKREWVS